MDKLNRQQVVATWLWGDEYAKSDYSAIDWYKRLPASCKRRVMAFIDEYERARELERSLGASTAETTGATE